jgi:hypothetical protein
MLISQRNLKLKTMKQSLYGQAKSKLSSRSLYTKVKRNSSSKSELNKKKESYQNTNVLDPFQGEEEKTQDEHSARKKVNDSDSEPRMFIKNMLE